MFDDNVAKLTGTSSAFNSSNNNSTSQMAIVNSAARREAISYLKMIDVCSLIIYSYSYFINNINSLFCNQYKDPTRQIQRIHHKPRVPGTSNRIDFQY
jgi:hypothetical protein